MSREQWDVLEALCLAAAEAVQAALAAGSEAEAEATRYRALIAVQVALGGLEQQQGGTGQ